MVRHHSRIADHFGSGIGVELQKMDGDIAAEVIKHFTSKKVPVLCIHDSFIVQQECKLELYGIMRKFYYERFGRNIEVTSN